MFRDSVIRYVARSWRLEHRQRCLKAPEKVRLQSRSFQRAPDLHTER